MSEDANEFSALIAAKLSKLASLLDGDQRAEALALLEQSLPELVGSLGVVPKLIATLKNHGTRATALACLNAVRKALPKNVDLKLFRIDILIRLGKLEAARSALELLSGEEHRPVYWRHKLAIELGLDQFAAAEQSMLRSRDASSKDSLVLRHAEIKVLIAQEAFDGAADKSVQALRAFSGASSLHVQHVRLILARDGAHAALPNSETVAKRFKSSIHAQLIFADCQRAVGQRHAALQQLETTARRFPQSALPRIRLSRINLELGHRDKALVHIQAARALDAGVIPVELTYADVLIKLGRREDAVARLQWLVDNKQVTPSVLTKLISSLLALRHDSEADRYVRLGLEKFPDSSTLLKSLVLHKKRGHVSNVKQLTLADLSSHVPQSRLEMLTARRALGDLDTDTAIQITRKKPVARREPEDVGLIARALIVAGKSTYA